MIDLYTFIVLVGAYQFTWWISRFLLSIYRAVLGTHCTTERYGENSWAVVTGSTDGIGKACAKYLARQGFNIVLVSRNLEKLNATAKELQEIGKSQQKEIKTRVIALDMTAPGNQKAQVYEKIFAQKLSDIDISILINNAGYAHAGAFCEISDAEVHNQLTCNTYPVLLLTQQVIRSFKSRYERFGIKSLLCSTASIAGQTPLPYVATYSASKRFVDFVMWAMREELSSYGVDVCSWQTATVSTKLTSFAKGGIAVTPDYYAEGALSRCTSGANGGVLKHDLALMLIQNITDVMPLKSFITQSMTLTKKAADKVKAQELAKMGANNGTQAYTELK